MTVLISFYGQRDPTIYWLVHVSKKSFNDLVAEFEQYNCGLHETCFKVRPVLPGHHPKDGDEDTYDIDDVYELYQEDDLDQLTLEPHYRELIDIITHPYGTYSELSGGYRLLPITHAVLMG
jgi:hypothetical protein